MHTLCVASAHIWGPFKRVSAGVVPQSHAGKCCWRWRWLPHCALPLPAPGPLFPLWPQATCEWAMSALVRLMAPPGGDQNLERFAASFKVRSVADGDGDGGVGCARAGCERCRWGQRVASDVCDVHAPTQCKGRITTSADKPLVQVHGQSSRTFISMHARMCTSMHVRSGAGPARLPVRCVRVQEVNDGDSMQRGMQQNGYGYAMSEVPGSQSSAVSVGAVCAGGGCMRCWLLRPAKPMQLYSVQHCSLQCTSC